MVFQEVNHFQGILHVTLYTQAQCFHTLQQDEGIEWGNGSTGVTQDDGTDAGDVSSSAYCIGKYDTMIRRIWFCQSGELVGVLLPVELTTIDDDTTQRSTMSAQELSGRVYHDVCSVLKRTNQVRCTKGVVDDEGNAVFMGHLSHTFYICNVRIGVSEGLCVDSLGVRLDGCFQSGEVIHLDDGV